MWRKWTRETCLIQFWVKSAVAQFPADVEILLLGIQAATANSAFKKVGDLAKTILKHDPINTKARKFLLFSNLSHARKQMKHGKYNVVRQEFKQAEAMERVNQRSGLVQVNQGWLAVLEEQPDQALDINGILQVSAKEKRTGLSKFIVIDNAISRFEQDQLMAETRPIAGIIGKFYRESSLVQ